MGHPRKGPGPTGRTALYRFYSSEGELLYVGITHNLEQRWANHARRQPWWLDVAERTVEWHETRSVAGDLEDKALREEEPLYDRTGKPRHRLQLVDDRLSLETGRALAAIGGAIYDGMFPAWRIMPPIGELSERFRIPLVAVTDALGVLSHTHAQVVRFGDRFVPGDPSEVPKLAAGKYGGVYILASKVFGDASFSLAEFVNATGYPESTADQRMRKLVKAQVLEYAGVSTRGARLFRVARHPEPDPPKLLAYWGRDDVLALANWLREQMDDDPAAQSFADRDREIIAACLPDEYGVSRGGVRVLKVMARRYTHRPGCQAEWGIEAG